MPIVNYIIDTLSDLKMANIELMLENLIMTCTPVYLNTRTEIVPGSVNEMNPKWTPFLDENGELKSGFTLPTFIDGQSLAYIVAKSGCQNMWRMCCKAGMNPCERNKKDNGTAFHGISWGNGGSSLKSGLSPSEHTIKLEFLRYIIMSECGHLLTEVNINGESLIDNLCGAAQ